MTSDIVIGPDDPRGDDVRDLLGRHLRRMHETTPIEDVHALDLDGLLAPSITFCSARRDGELLGIGAVKRLDATHAELKSMHTAEAARRQGIGGLMLDHLVDLARERGATRVSLETGSQAAFEPARMMYAAAGFVECGPFGDYRPSANSTFMTLAL